jgi:hypothetical protein
VDADSEVLHAVVVANQNDVRRIASKLPGTSEGKERFAFSVRNGRKEKGFVWVWMERTDPKKARVPNPDVLAVRVADLDEKDALLAMNKKTFFTEPHYAGFPAILVRLPLVHVDDLKPLITAAWRCQAPRATVDDFESRQQPPKQKKPRSKR